MTFTIPAHGVKNAVDNPTLSVAQHRLLNEPKPIRLCGSPTGAGKTYAFIEAARQGQSVFFVVPTQALATDIHESIQAQNAEKPILSAIWDSRQTMQAKEAGQLSWAERKAQFDQIEKEGGMILATLESLANLTMDQPKYQYIHLDVVDLLWRFQHLVFDEAHTLNTRAFGLLHLWITLIAFRYQNHLTAPKLTLLSATHSDLLENLLQEAYLPRELISCFEEDIDETPDRYIHRTVQVFVHDQVSILELATQYAAALLQEKGKLLFIYDSLRQITQDEMPLAQLLCDECGLQADDVIMINGQDKHLERSAGGSGFAAGTHPKEQHKVIIGTSAVEMGVNFKIDAAIIEQGLDAAALLQRIGRVARNDQTGIIHISHTKSGETAHIIKLKECQGELPINELRNRFKPLRHFNHQAAKARGSAYWAMLSRKNSALMAGIKEMFTEVMGQDVPVPGKQLRSLWVVEQIEWREKRFFLQWLKAIERELQDVRGFAPTVKIQFQDKKAILYSRDWVSQHLRTPDDYQDDTYIYRDVRDNCLRKKSVPPSCVFFSPFGKTGPIQGWNTADAYKSYLNSLKNSRQNYFVSKPEVKLLYEKAEAFIRATALLPRDAENEGILIDSDRV